MNRLDFEGLNEFVIDLRQLPTALRDEAYRIVDDTLETAASSLRQAYPRRTGNLRRGVRTSIKRTQYEVVGTLYSSAPHAQLYEFGTGVERGNPVRVTLGQGRQHKYGPGIVRGSSRPHPTLVPIVTRLRRQMNERFATLLARRGFQVTGAAA